MGSLLEPSDPDEEDLDVQVHRAVKELERDLRRVPALYLRLIMERPIAWLIGGIVMLALMFALLAALQAAFGTVGSVLGFLGLGGFGTKLWRWILKTWHGGPTPGAPA